jgi:chromosome segregation ATPase
LHITEREKDEIFDQLQMRQAELESSQSHLESLQNQVAELKHQLREGTDRIALLNEELVEAHKAQVTRVPTSTPSAEVTKLLSAAETKYEARIADLRRQLSAVERERDETEADLNKKITEKTKEVEQLKSTVGMTAKAREDEEEIIASLKKEIAGLREAGTTYERLVADLQSQAGRVTEIEVCRAHMYQLVHIGYS